MEHDLSLTDAAKKRSEEDKRSIGSENTVLRKLVKTVMQQVEKFDLKKLDVQVAKLETRFQQF